MNVYEFTGRCAYGGGFAIVAGLTMREAHETLLASKEFEGDSNETHPAMTFDITDGREVELVMFYGREPKVIAYFSAYE